jgi:hypothetical protein
MAINEANFTTKLELLDELHSQLHTRDLNFVPSALLASDETINFTKNPAGYQ